ncbi:MAG: DUF4474 domain-containing protein [Lachnospiraceae bacterium]|nr:DUF4474 domain-containing protein [Lachnospiraceae bacterium]
MKYVLIVLAALLVILAVLLICCALRCRKARRKVCRRSREQKCHDLNAALEPFGFAYDSCSDIFYSRMHPWQRETGYCRFYDEHAPLAGIVIHSEPVYFTCGKRQYLMEFWKGQYGTATGAEMGLYVSNEPPESGKRPEDLFYESVSDRECLPMEFRLRRDGNVILERRGVHWWLTGFLLGEFSHADRLSMELGVSFPNNQMCAAFVEGLRRAGYRGEEIRIEGTKVSIVFGSPRTRQPRHLKIHIVLVQWINRCNCRLYRKFTSCFTCGIDRIDYIGMCFPRLYRAMICVGRSKSLRAAQRRMRRKGQG